MLRFLKPSQSRAETNKEVLELLVQLQPRLNQRSYNQRTVSAESQLQIHRQQQLKQHRRRARKLRNLDRNQQNQCNQHNLYRNCQGLSTMTQHQARYGESLASANDSLVHDQPVLTRDLH